VGGGYLTQKMMKAFTRGRRISYPKDDEGIHSWEEDILPKRYIFK
jgi:hypothetical protein